MKYFVLLSLLLVSAGISAEEIRSLPDLIQEAVEHNCGLLAHRERIAAACHLRQAKLRSFLPEIGAEGGVYTENLDLRNDHYKYGFLKANWNLFRGGADTAQLQILGCEEAMAQLSFSQASKALIHEICEAYYHLLYLDHALGLYEEALKHNETYENQAKRRWESGLTSEVDRLEFQLRADHLRTEANILRGERYLRHSQLLTLVGCPELEADFELEGDFLRPENLDIDALFQQALCQREEKQMAHHQQRIRTYEQRQVEAESWPLVDLYASYGYEPDTLGERSSGSRVAVNISVPLFDGGSRCHRRQAARRLSRAEQFSHCELEKTVYREISAAAMQSNLLLDSLKQTESRLEKITAYWNATSEEYQRGIKNSPDLSSAADQVLQTKLRALELKRDYSLGRVHLSSVVGTLPPI